MAIQLHSQMANFIWSICNLLRGPYKRNEYRKVILPLTVLRRFDCILDPTKDKVLEEFQSLKGKSENIINAKLREITGVPFYNLSKLNFPRLLDDPNHIAPNLNSYINSFSPNIRQIFERFDFGIQINKLNEKNLLFNVIKKFASDQMDLSPSNIDSMQMGYVFEELIRIGAEQSNEEAGEHFTPREVIKLMVNLLLFLEEDLRKSHVVKTIYDPACGTGGMLSVAEQYIRDLNSEAQPHLYGQDWNDEAYAICRADMLIKGEDADNIKPDCTFEKDGFKKQKFDYMLANPPFGVEWKQQQKTIEDERDTLGYEGRFGAGTPRINDGSPLFTGDAGSGESNIRQWIIENDWLEAIVALPDQLFYNTGISTYIWIISNRKEKRRKGRIQLINARNYFVKMRKSLGNKRHQIGDGEDNRPDQISVITEIYGNFKHNETRKFSIDGQEKELEVSKIFDNIDFGFNKITVERPLRLNFQASEDRINRLDDLKGFISIAESKKKNETVRQEEIEAGQKRQQVVKTLLTDLGKATSEQLFKDRVAFLKELKKMDHAAGVRLSAPELKVILEALSERDETAEVCRDAKDRPEPDSDLRDTENVPLKENVEEYFKREVLPHVLDAWIDHKKTKVGYEISLNRHFYRYEPPRELEEIETDIKELERDIVSMLAEIAGSIGVSP